jgi:hypothetical protein
MAKTVRERRSWPATILFATLVAAGWLLAAAAARAAEGAC